MLIFDRPYTYIRVYRLTQERLLLELEGVPELAAGSGGKGGLKVLKYHEEEEEEEEGEQGEE